MPTFTPGDTAADTGAQSAPPSFNVINTALGGFGPAVRKGVIISGAYTGSIFLLGDAGGEASGLIRVQYRNGAGTWITIEEQTDAISGPGTSSASFSGSSFSVSLGTIALTNVAVRAFCSGSAIGGIAAADCRAQVTSWQVRVASVGGVIGV